MEPREVMIAIFIGATPGALVAPSARSLHVAAWQGAAVTADVPANIARVVSEVAAAGEDGVELLLFPEMFLHGYDATEEQLRKLALTQDSPELMQVADAAAEARVCVGVPYAECDGEAVFNSIAVFDATGELVFNYRKVNLWGDWEQGLFERGAPGSYEPFELTTASGTTVTCGCLICFDIEFPEPSRALALQGAELLLVPTALGAGDVEMTTPFNVLPTRALENHVHIVYCNLEGGADAAERPGQSGVPSFCGRSAIFDPAGATAARAAELTGGMRLSATLDLDCYDDAVARNPYLTDYAQRFAAGHYDALLLPAVGRLLLADERRSSRLARLAGWARRVLGLGGADADADADAADADERAAVMQSGSLNAAGEDVGGRPDAGSRAEERRVQRFLRGLPKPTRFRYSPDGDGEGGSDEQHVDLFTPAETERLLASSSSSSSSSSSEGGGGGGGGGALPTVIIVHGGFFKDKWSARNTQTTSLVPFLLERGLAVALVEYRRRGMRGGTYPGPEDDVTAALAAVAARPEVDASRIVVLGHSAGATLAVAACERARAAGTAAASLCVSIAPVPEMVSAHEAKLSDEGDAIEMYLGGPPSTEAARRRYAVASLPTALTTPTLLVTGTDDADVPSRLVTDYAARCQQAATPATQGTQTAQGSTGGGNVTLLEIPLAGHYDVVTADAMPWLSVWQKTTELIARHAGWSVPPRAADYGVTRERGFLPKEDPPASLLPLGDDADPTGEASALFRAWEEAAAALPGLLAARNVRQVVAMLPTTPAPPVWIAALQGDERKLERCYSLLSFLAHAAVWGEEPYLTTLPAQLAVPWVAVAEQTPLQRQPILTYASFNLHNWQRIDPSRPVELGNTRRSLNFLGGMDEEWFSAVHVAIEARAGAAVVAAAEAQRLSAGLRARGGRADSGGAKEHARVKPQIVALLREAAESIEASVAILQRMGERCDPYIYHQRVRTFMSGWTHESMPQEGLSYAGVPARPARQADADGGGGGGGGGHGAAASKSGLRCERYFGETGAQSSVVPALDAALGIGMSEDDLLPYLLAMRSYMPPEHAAFIEALERGPDLRDAVVGAADAGLTTAYDRVVAALVSFRKLHFELAFTYVRQWDSRKDDEIQGTGGTPFMPYLRKHRRTTYETLIEPARSAVTEKSDVDK